MEFKNIIYKVEDNIATIQLNRPKALNALNSGINNDILAALELVKADRSIRVLIITGNEKAFAAGADIKEMCDATPSYARSFCSAAIDINNTLESLPIPTIAAVNGFALGGGCELALACDFRVAGYKSRFGLPEVSLGIIPGACGTQRLIPLVGLAKTREVVMLNTIIKGEEALAIGLVNRLVDDAEVYDEAVRLAKELMAKPALALAAAKTAINAGAYGTIEEGKKIECNEFALLFDTHDQKEGMKAMLENREPKFTNS
ncbi:MAG TPA: crotonase [Clostridiales bacterium]|nr:crotonase [Clostridiales bacterium]